MQQLDQETIGSLKYHLRGGILYYKHRVYISQSNPIKKWYTELYSWQSNLMAHRVWENTKKGKERFLLGRDEIRHTKLYKILWSLTCQRAKGENTKPSRLLQPLPIPTRPWSSISMDFIEGLPKSNQYSVIMVVVDRLTKYAYFIPVSHPYSATKIANLFSQNVVKLHRLPNNIISDRDLTFTSKF